MFYKRKENIHEKYMPKIKFCKINFKKRNIPDSANNNDNSNNNTCGNDYINNK